MHCKSNGRWGMRRVIDRSGSELWQHHLEFICSKRVLQTSTHPQRSTCLLKTLQSFLHLVLYAHASRYHEHVEKSVRRKTTVPFTTSSFFFGSFSSIQITCVWPERTPLWLQLDRPYTSLNHPIPHVLCHCQKASEFRNSNPPR